MTRLGAECFITFNPEEIKGAQKIILPGVGHFDHAMSELIKSGMREKLDELVMIKKVPVIGICVGMQMLFSESEESPGVTGLNVVPGVVRYLPPTVKRPQMQWNQLQLRATPESHIDPLFASLPAEPWMYFVHSLHGVPTDASCIVATADYGCEVTAAVRVGNVSAVQFHPEKSASDGLALLRNFVDAARLVAA